LKSSPPFRIITFKQPGKHGTHHAIGADAQSAPLNRGVTLELTKAEP
jgi:hypothetical protein